MTTLQASGAVLASADLSPTFPPEMLLRVMRTWRVDDGKLVLRFELKNRTAKPVQISALATEREAYVIPLKSCTTWIEVAPRAK